MTRCFLKCAFVGMALFLGASTAKADLISITLDNASLSSGSGSAVTFTGTLTNSSGGEVFLNGASADLTYSELTFDPTPFFNDVPLSLNDGDTYSGPLFSIALSAVAQPGDYAGTFTIQGGGDSATFDPAGSAGFDVVVTSSAPEPSSAVLLLLGIVFLSATRLSCRRSKEFRG